MTFPTFGYDNLFEQGTLTASTEATGFEKERAIDGFTYDSWKPSSAGTSYLTVDLGSSFSADYWAVFTRDVGTNSGSVKPQYSSDNFVGDTNDFDTAWSPADGEAIKFSVVTQQSARYWRIELISTPASNIIAIAIGTALTFERDVQVGFMVPTLATQNENRWNVSQNGQILGESLQRNGIELTATFDALTPAWVRTNWPDLIAALETKAVFFSWRPNTYASEAAFVRVMMNGSRMPAYSSPLFMSASISMMGLVA